MIFNWIANRLDDVKDHDRVIIRDYQRILPLTDQGLLDFIQKNAFTLIEASTNLVFRDLYETAIQNRNVGKILIIDRSPKVSTENAYMQAPPIFYPDLLFYTEPPARILIDLRSFLKDVTGDSEWPAEVNENRYARLIARHLSDVVVAHRNLRNAHPTRFDNSDLQTIVAYAALGIASSAFKKPEAGDYWKICLFGYEAYGNLKNLFPEIIRPLDATLKSAPAPFCFFLDNDSDLVFQAFYLSLILAQHVSHWDLLLANIDPALEPFRSMKNSTLSEAAQKLADLDPKRAAFNLMQAEKSLDSKILQLILVDQLKITESDSFIAILKNERYSSLFSSLAILMALDALMTGRLLPQKIQSVIEILRPTVTAPQTLFSEPQGLIDLVADPGRAELADVFIEAAQVLTSKQLLKETLQKARGMQKKDFTWNWFDKIWFKEGVHRLEYRFSMLERRIYNQNFFAEATSRLPEVFNLALERIQKQVTAWAAEVSESLVQLNLMFQTFVAANYAGWVKSDSEMVLTSQFIRRCLKPNWDPQTEKAALFIFDGMRPDVWDEFLGPALAESFEFVREYRGLALLPTETHVSRKAISAGDFPDSFDSHAGEDRLLQAGLQKHLNLACQVEVIPPKTLGTGETVRYRAGNLDVFIFELCDKELHKIHNRKLSDGRVVPEKPIALIFQQIIRNIIENEVMTIVRTLEPGTRVFITADHGFGPIGQNRLNVFSEWLNTPEDCSYLNTRTVGSLQALKAPVKFMENTIEMPVSSLRLPATEVERDRYTGQSYENHYASVVFPRSGYAFARPDTNFKPFAFSHGGISLQEMLVPMIVLRSRDRGDSLLMLEEITGPAEINEGQEVEYRLVIRSKRKAADELRVTVDVTLSGAEQHKNISRQTMFLAAQGAEGLARFVFEAADATTEERQAGQCLRTLHFSVSCHEEKKNWRKSISRQITVVLNSERVVRRIPGKLGSILGLKPKG